LFASLPLHGSVALWAYAKMAIAVPGVCVTVGFAFATARAETWKLPVMPAAAAKTLNADFLSRISTREKS
jgi:hypothetical protein